MKKFFLLGAMALAFVLSGCIGPRSIPENYFGTFQVPNGGTIEISASGVKLSGFQAIGADDQTLTQGFYGYDDIRSAIRHSQSGVYVFPFEIIGNDPDQTSDGQLQWRLHSSNQAPDSCSYIDDRFNIKVSKTQFQVNLVANVHVSEHKKDEVLRDDPLELDIVDGKAAGISFFVDLEHKEKIMELKGFANLSEISSVDTVSKLHGYYPCDSSVIVIEARDYQAPLQTFKRIK